MKKRSLFLVVLALVLILSLGQSVVVEASRTDLKLSIDSDVSTLHPTDYSTSNEKHIIGQVYDPLMKPILDGVSEPEPRIAKSYEIVDGGLGYIFHLRDDIVFHDGTQLTAEDVAFTLELYQKSAFQGARVGGLANVEIIDDYTIKLTTEGVYAPFFESVIDIHIASKNYYNSVDASTFAQQPIGSGPYKFVSREVGNRIILESHEDYYRGAPAIKDVIVRVINDQTTVAIALQTGDIDFASISPASYDMLLFDPNIVIEEVPQSGFTFVAMNHEKYPFNQVKFRQAIAYAVDRENMVDLTANGLAEVNSNIVSPFRFGYSDDQPKYEYNPEKAKELLAEVGISTPYNLGVMYVAEQYSNEAQVLQSDLANVGLNVTLEILEFNAYLQKLMSGEYTISVLNMVLEGPTHHIGMAFTEEFIGRANNSRYTDPEVEQWFKDATVAIDDDERFEIYNKIFTKVQEEAVYVVLYNKSLLYAHSSDLICPEFQLEGVLYLEEFSW